MDKKKANFCTLLFAFALIVLLYLSTFVRNEELGIDLFQLIVYTAATWWFMERVEKFYRWLVSK